MPKKVAWGYVTRDIGNGGELLIATRCKEDDPKRAGELIIPGGGLKENENYLDAAIREVYEETGIVAKVNNYQFPIEKHMKFDNEKIFAEVYGNKVYLKYKDSEKDYLGIIFRLYPIDENQNPSEQEDSDAKNPRYISFKSIEKEKFTPACQVLLDISGF